MNIRHKLLSYLGKKCYQQHCKPLDTDNTITAKVCKVYISCKTLAQLYHAEKYSSLFICKYDITGHQREQIWKAYKKVYKEVQ